MRAPVPSAVGLQCVALPSSVGVGSEVGLGRVHPPGVDAPAEEVAVHLLPEELAAPRG